MMHSYSARIKQGLIVVFLLALILSIGDGSPALSCCSAVLLAPSTDVVPTGRLSLEMQGDSATPVRPDSAKAFVNAEIGLARNLEVGVDLDVSSDAHERAIGNGKYRFELGRDTGAAMAFGVQSIDGRFKSIPYVTASKETSFGRLHAGALRSDEATRPFVGYDKPLNSKLTFLADYISGREFFASLGINYEFSEHFAVLTYAQFPNNGEDVIYSVHLVVCESAW